MADIRALTASEIIAAIPAEWAPDVLLDAEQEEFWAFKKGGEGKQKAILEKEELEKGAGDTIKVTTMTRSQGAGTVGDNELKGNEGKSQIGSFEVKIDYVRYAEAWTQKADDMSIISFINVTQANLVSWFAEKLSDDTFKAMLGVPAPTATRIFAGNATSEADINDTHITTLADLDKIIFTLGRMGALPMRVEKKSGEVLKYYGYVMSDVEAYRLSQNTEFRNMQIQGNIRGEDNPIFTGAMGTYRGLILYTHQGIEGTKGTPLRPESYLMNDIAIGTVNIPLVDGETRNDYTRNFNPIGESQFFVRIGDEVIRCESKTNNTIIANPATIAAHYAGDRVTYCGTTSTPTVALSYGVAFGAEAVTRGKGRPPKKIKQLDDYDMRIGLGVQAVYGYKAVVNTRNRCPNFLIMTSYGGIL